MFAFVCRPAAVTSRCFCCANQTYNSSTAGCGVMSLAKKRLDCFGKLGRRKKRDKKYEHLATQQENSNKSVGTVMKMMVGSAAVFHHWIWNEATSQTLASKVEESDMDEPKTHITHETQIRDNICKLLKSICEPESEKLLLWWGASCLSSSHLVQITNPKKVQKEEHCAFFFFLKVTIKRKKSPTKSFEKK